MQPQAGSQIEFKALPAITREQLNRYADASGDHNLIHLDEEVAKGVGLPGVIAHGMLIAGFVAERARTYIEDEMGLAWKLVQLQTRFKGMTFPGDVISVGGTVKEVNGLVVLDLVARNEAGDVKVMGSARYQRA